LRERGHEVHTPTLTGLGDRAHLATPDVTLDTHIEDLIAYLRYSDLTDVVLVGWSYGGMVVAGAADGAPERIAHLVYLDSDVPRDGETSVPPGRHAALTALARAHGDGWRVPASALASRLEAFVLRDVPAEERQWISERFAPQPVRCWTQPIRLRGAASATPTTYLRCAVGYDADDEDTRRQDERIRSEPAWTFRELPAAHSAPFSAPDVVADALVKIASTR
jgi:pimeloyl-ACP methyl ester carboxylesterase